MWHNINNWIWHYDGIVNSSKILISPLNTYIFLQSLFFGYNYMYIFLRKNNDILHYTVKL